MSSFNPKSEFRRPENPNKPITKSEKFNVAELSLLRECWVNNHAHVILTAEAHSLPTDEKKLLEDYGLVGCHSSRSNDLSVHARIDSTGYVRLLWESSEEDDKNSYAAILDMRFGKKAEEVIAELRERTAASLFIDLEAVASVVEGSDSNTDDNFVHTARCMQDTKERHLVTRSGLQRLRCSVCHLHHERAMYALAFVRQFFNTVLRQFSSLQGRCHCWRCHRGSIQVPQTSGVPGSAQFFSCHYVERDAT